MKQHLRNFMRGLKMKIENCPYCNNTKEVEKVLLKDLTCWQVRCYNCNIKGEIAQDKEIAIQAWNERVRRLRK